YAVYARGDLALIGLDGLQVSGTAIFQVNTTTSEMTVGSGATTFTIPGGKFQFTGSNVHFRVPGLIDIGGTVDVTRSPDGTLNVNLAGASVSVTIDGTNIFTNTGSAGFQIGSNGFRLSSFKVNGFSIFDTV